MYRCHDTLWTTLKEFPPPPPPPAFLYKVRQILILNSFLAWFSAHLLVSTLRCGHGADCRALRCTFGNDVGHTTLKKFLVTHNTHAFTRSYERVSPCEGCACVTVWGVCLCYRVRGVPVTGTAEEWSSQVGKAWSQLGWTVLFCTW